MFGVTSGEPRRSPAYKAHTCSALCTICLTLIFLYLLSFVSFKLFVIFGRRIYTGTNSSSSKNLDGALVFVMCHAGGGGSEVDETQFVALRRQDRWVGGGAR